MATTPQVTVVVTAATSTPVVGSSSTTVTSAAFTPQLGRDMYISLTGNWTGTVQVQRSTNGGTTWNNLTVAGGQPWARFTNNADEVVDHPTDANAIYRLSITVTSGSVNYRLAQ